MTTLTAEKALAAQAIGHLLFQREMKDLLWVHWCNMYEDSRNFFAMTYGQYLRAPGPKQGDEKGVRGVMFMSWPNMDAMRKGVREHKAAKDQHSEPRRKIKVNYVTIDRISHDSKVKRLAHEYDPNTSFIVYMRCESPSYTDIKVIPRDAKGIPTRCSEPSCNVTGADKKLSTCGRCGTAVYCSRICQLSDRPRHKMLCVEAQVTSPAALPLP